MSRFPPTTPPGAGSSGVTDSSSQAPFVDPLVRRGFFRWGTIGEEYTSVCIVVYMSRTNIDIDDELVQMVMNRYDLRTKKDAVNFALRKAVGNVLSREEALAMEGYGWDGDLAEIRAPMKIEQWD